MRSKSRLNQKRNIYGWLFLIPAVALIATMSFVPAVSALVTSFQTGNGTDLHFGGFKNYTRILKDDVFIQSVKNCFFYLIIQVPVMLILALILASMLNNRKLRFKGFMRTCIFLPCATSLVAYSIIFRTLFATDGFVNLVATRLHFLSEPYNFLAHPTSAKIVIIIALVWRWTGYNMVFYLAGLQNIEYSVYEAAKIDGASAFQTFLKITVPLLKPTILLTAIMSTNGTLQLFDESVNLTNGGPSNASITMSHYIYNQAFQGVPKFGYTSAMSFVILFLVAILAAVQLKVGDKRD
ncbi:MAG: sugar ABC transporter permease [Lachnospiraceae bacterium]|nr:sugar ABC transporter permease [Lachnospiraceae bacterium]